MLKLLQNRALYFRVLHIIFFSSVFILTACSSAPVSPTPSGTLPPVLDITPTTSYPTVKPTLAVTSTQVEPTVTKPPTLTPTPCINKARFISETIPDDTVFDAGAQFEKSWTLENTGTCTWDEGYGFKLVSPAGGLLMSSVQSNNLPKVVTPGEQVTIKLTLRVPEKAGTFRSDLFLVNSNDITFGIGAVGQSPVYVQVKAELRETAVPGTTVAAKSCLKAAFVNETVPDNSKVFTGEIINKEWTVKNNGTCEWKNIRLPWLNGGGFGMPPGAPRSGNPHGDVAVGESITLGWPLIAPLDPGTYRADFMLGVDDGSQFGVGKNADTPLYVQVIAVDAPQPASDEELASQLGSPTILDNFDINDGAWNLSVPSDEYSKLTITDGALVFEVKQYYEFWTARGAMPLRRGQVNQATFVTDDSCSGQNSYGIITSLNDRDGILTNGYIFQFNCSGEYSISYIDETSYADGNGPYVLLAETFSGAINPGPNQTNRMTIISAGGKIGFYANGVRLAQIKNFSATLYEQGVEIKTVDFDMSQFEYYLLPYHDPGFPGLFIDGNQSNFKVYVTEYAFWNLDDLLK